MNMLDILLVAGITNVLFLLLVIFSCRCMGFWRITKWIFGYENYQKFYKFHCFFWYGLIISVFIHATLAIYLFGIPFVN